MPNSVTICDSDLYVHSCPIFALSLLEKVLVLFELYFKQFLLQKLVSISHAETILTVSCQNIDDVGTWTSNTSNAFIGFIFVFSVTVFTFRLKVHYCAAKCFCRWSYMLLPWLLVKFLADIIDDDLFQRRIYRQKKHRSETTAVRITMVPTLRIIPRQVMYYLSRATQIWWGCLFYLAYKFQKLLRKPTNIGLIALPLWGLDLSLSFTRTSWYYGGHSTLCRRD